MSHRLRSALLWGIVGALSFLVLHGTYLLVGGAFLGVGTIAGVAVVVFGASTIGSYYAEERFGVFGRRFGDKQ